MDEEAIDLDALGAAARSDPASLDELLRAIRPYVVRVCKRCLPNELDAEDATQDALLAVAAGIERFDATRSSMSTWVYAIATNKSRDTYRRLVRQSATVIPAELPADRRTSVLAGHRVDLLAAADQVDDRYSSTVLLRDLVGLSYEEVAEALDVPIGTVRSRLAKGRNLMAEALGS